METKLLYAKDSSAINEINQAAEILKKGGLVAIPTETVYGLAASAFDTNAIKNIFVAKGRPNDNPLIVHISNMESLFEIAKDVPPIAKQCMERFWPGPFTAVLKKTDKIPLEVSGGLDTVAVRMPKNEVAAKIIAAASVPLAAPSANRSGSPSPSTAQHVIDDLTGRIDAIVVSEKSSVGLESTVVTFATNPPRLLRPGGVTPEQLTELIPDLVIDSAVTAPLEKNKDAASPGMKYKHYAPKADVVMVSGGKEAFAQYVSNSKNGFDLALCFEQDIENLNISFISLGDATDYKKQAAVLFESLRLVDKNGYNKVAVHAPDQKGLGLAVYNRLIRAAGFKVINL